MFDKDSAVLFPCVQCGHTRCSGAHPPGYALEVSAVKQLLVEGWSQAAVAEHLNVSRKYVGAIAHGAEAAPLCEFCKASFFPRRTGTKKPRFCGSECALSHARGEPAAAT